jgi:glycosyltransferase involved in cell wall biosynthesis
MKDPKLSVILPTYNAAEHLDKAIDSILGQTFTDFELIIINDGSTDGTHELLRSYFDPRIQVINQANLGLPKALNEGIKASRGIYLARQDADDISLSERFEKQVSFLDEHPSYGLVGSWSQIMTPTGPTSRQHLHPTSNGQLQVQLLMNNQFVHSSVMMRTSCLTITGPYSEDPEHFPPEDYDLWLKFAKHFRVANLPEALLHYMEIPTSISRTKEDLIQARAAKMSRDSIRDLLHLERNMENIAIFVEAANGRRSKMTICQYLQIQALITKIGAKLKQKFPLETKDIYKGIAFLRFQIHKSLLKSYIRRY